MRIGIFRVIFSFSLAFLGLALFFVQVVRGQYYRTLSLRNSIRIIPEEPCRGRILDRNLNVMADNILSFDVALLPQELKDKKIIFEGAARILSANPQALLRVYERGYLNPVTPVIIAKGVSKTMAIAIEEGASDLAGMRVELNPRRFYPYGAVAAHLLGYIGEIDRGRITKLKEYGYDLKDFVGYSGLEERLDMMLRGEKGGRQMEVDSGGRQVRLLGYRPPRPGQDAVTTIDLELQQLADRHLAGQKGAVVLMDVKTGEILVMSSSPGFDPNVFVARKDKRSLNFYLTSDEAPLFNRALSGQFPPGSVFKVVTALAALGVKKISPSTTYTCTGQLRVGDRYFKCWSTHGPQDFMRAMAHSCDVYFYRLGLTAGVEMMAQVAHDLGLGAPSGADLSGEASGFIPTRLWKRVSRLENWYDGDTANFSIGQGYVLTTPLQVARMMAAIANGGYLIDPYLTKAVAGDVVFHREPRRIRIPQEHLGMIREALRYPVLLESGTAHDLNIEGLNICAKTGTAQVPAGASHGWVAGFFPKENPRYAFCILLENVGSSHYACALGRHIFEEAARRGKL